MKHLSNQDIRTLAALLDAREKVLRSGVHEHVLKLLESNEAGHTTPIGDMADQAEVGLHLEHENAAVVRDVQELRDIEAARERISGGEAGICVNCGGEIPFPRLYAQPTAARCVRCQSVFERTNATGLDAAFRQI
jgi:DnaK suppressor protein